MFTDLSFVALVLLLIMIIILFFQAVKVTWQRSPFSREGEADRLIFSPFEMVYFGYKVLINFAKVLAVSFRTLA